MKITIDEKVCTKHKMTLQEVLIALAVRNTDACQEIPNMLKREILVEDKSEDWYKVTQHWSDVLNDILCDSSQQCEKTDEELLELAKKMREVYPQGKMKDRFGATTPYYYRCNNSEVSKALKRFFTEKGNYTDEEIIDATRRYVADFQGQYWQKGMRLLKYFIIKNPIKQGEDGRGYVEQVSDLETYLNNKESEEEVEVTNSDDWLMNSRN
jgi:hypothetical protein